MFSNLSSSSISLATVTPSLVTVGAPNDLSRTTFRPFGPSVTVTASARMLTPRRILSLASWENFTSLAAISSPCSLECVFRRARLVGVRGRMSVLSLDDPEYVFLAYDEMLLPVQLDLGARVLAEQDAI